MNVHYDPLAASAGRRSTRRWRGSSREGTPTPAAVDAFLAEHDFPLAEPGA